MLVKLDCLAVFLFGIGEEVSLDILSLGYS
jgi:hypothetical protein